MAVVGLLAGVVGGCSDAHPTEDGLNWSDLPHDGYHGDTWAELDEHLASDAESACELGPLAGCCDHHLECPHGWYCDDGSCSAYPGMDEEGPTHAEADHMEEDGVPPLCPLHRLAHDQSILGLDEPTEQNPETPISVHAPLSVEATRTPPIPSHPARATTDRDVSAGETEDSDDTWLHSDSRVVREGGEVFHVICSYPGFPGLYFGEDCDPGVFEAMSNTE